MSKGEMSLKKCQSTICVTSLFVKYLTLNKLGESLANVVLSFISTGEVNLHKKLKRRCKHYRME